MAEIPLIHTYITPRKFKQQLLYCLENRMWEEKFFYLGDKQVQNWFNLCQSGDYNHYRNFIALLKEIVPKLDKMIKGDVNLIGLAAGDSEKEKIILEQFLPKRKVGFFMVDTSIDLVRYSLKNLAKLNIHKEAFVADIMQQHMVRRIGNYVRKFGENRINLYTLMGGTVGIFSQSAIIKILRDAMQSEDFALIEFHVRRSISFKEGLDDTSIIFKAYEGKANKKVIFDMLETVNITEDYGDIDINYETHPTLPFLDTMDEHYYFYKDKKIDYLGEEFFFAKGEKILIGRHCVYFKETAERLLESYGMKVVETFQGDSENYITILCQRK